MNGDNFVGIVVLNWNNYKDTIECIESINKSNYSNKYIIIVDNASSDNSIEKICEFLNKNNLNNKANKKCEYCVIDKNFDNETDYRKYEVVIIKNNENGGYSKGNNLGLIFGEKFLNCDYLWVLNNDVIIDENCIGELVNFSKHKINDNGFIGTTVMEYYNPDIIQLTGGCRYNKYLGIGTPINKGKYLREIDNVTSVKFNYIGGCSIFAHRKNFEKVNNFSEDWFLYYEELDLMEKSKILQINSYWCKKALIYHKEGNTIGSKNIVQKKSKTSEYYSNISALKYTKKWHKNIFPIVFINRFVLKFFKYLASFDTEMLAVLFKSYYDYVKDGE